MSEDTLAGLRAQLEQERAARSEAEASKGSANVRSLPERNGGRGQTTHSSGGGFDAGADVPELYFTLRPYVDVEGVVPEPAPGRQHKFERRVNQIMVEAMPESDSSAEDFRPSIEEIAKAADENERVEKELREATAELCNGAPSKAQINQLSTRVFLYFFRWISGELTPEV